MPRLVNEYRETVVHNEGSKYGIDITTRTYEYTDIPSAVLHGIDMDSEAWHLIPRSVHGTQGQMFTLVWEKAKRVKVA